LDPLERFQGELDSLVDITYRVHNGLVCRPKEGYERALYSNLKRIKRNNSFTLLREDIAQQVRLMFLQFANQKSLNGSRMSLKAYILTRSVWGLRDWYRRELRVVDRLPTCGHEPTLGFTLNLKWLLFGDSLTPFQRYLIFLKFVQGNNILEISKTVYRDRHYVSKKLTEALNTLRSSYNATANYAG
jgi:hypothetical protein